MQDYRLDERPPDVNLVPDIYGALIDHTGPQMDNEREMLLTATPGQRALYTLAQADGEVNNGGFYQYFGNSGGWMIYLAIGGAELIGATAHVEILREAASVFPDGQVPEDRQERNDVLDSLSDELAEDSLGTLDDRWYAADQELDARLRVYVAAHPEEFFKT